MLFQNKLYSRDIFSFLKKETLFDSDYFFRNRYRKIILFWIDRFSKTRIFSNVYGDIPDTFILNLVSGAILGGFPEIYEKYIDRYCKYEYYNSFFLASVILAQNISLIDRMPQENYLSLRISCVSGCYYLINYYLSLLSKFYIEMNLKYYQKNNELTRIDNSIIKYLQNYYKKL